MEKLWTFAGWLGSAGVSAIVVGFIMLRQSKSKKHDKRTESRLYIKWGGIILVTVGVLFCAPKLISFFYPRQPVAVAVILGNHAGSRCIPDEAFVELETHLVGISNKGCLFAIVSDSSPFAQEIKGNTASEMIKRMKEQKADDTDVDLLAAIWEAYAALTSGDAENISRKQLVIIDTGISTAGVINFTEKEYDFFRLNMANRQDVNAIKDLIARRADNTFPDLNGIEVWIIGQADQFAKEADYLNFSDEDRRFIKSFWKTVLEDECHADVRFKSVVGWDKRKDDCLYIEGESGSYPFVSSVMVGYDSILKRPSGQSNGKPKKAVIGKIESRHLGFNMSSNDNLYNKSSTKEYLRPYAEDLTDFLKYYPDEKIIIAATSIPGTSNNEISPFESSRRRAEVVRELLVELGVNESSLIPIGLGDRFPWRRSSDEPGYTELDRAIWLMLLDSEEQDNMFNQLMDAYRNEELLPDTMEQIQAFMEPVDEKDKERLGAP